MKLKPSSYFLIFLILFAVVFLVNTLSFPPIQAKLVGIIASSVIIVLGIIQLFKEYAEAQATKEEPSEGESDSFLRRAGLLSFWVGGFIIITYLLGFLIASPLFVFSYLKVQGTRWFAAIVTAAVTTGFIYLLFEVFLLRTLWRGII